MPHAPLRFVHPGRKARLRGARLAAGGVLAVVAGLAPAALAEGSNLDSELASLQRTLDLIRSENAAGPTPASRPSPPRSLFGPAWPALSAPADSADSTVTRLSFVGDDRLHTLAFLGDHGVIASAQAASRSEGPSQSLVTLDASALRAGAHQRVHLFARASASGRNLSTRPLPGLPALEGVVAAPTPTAAAAGLALLAGGALRRRRSRP